MRYGNTADHLKRGVIVGLIIGAVGYIFSALMIVFYEKLPPERLIPLTFIIVVPALVIGLAIVPSLMFSIHILGDWVEHRFLERWTISRARASDFVSIISPAGLFAAKLQFSDGTKMRIFGAHLGILSSLDHYLESRKSKAEQGAAPKS
ncbi:hypothetical protein HNR46_003504 [Haloferula luteola]|uniref:PH domain-containing protein n=1 Tax=Haloferula luteola TaxID=595692 RepID=A0A840VHG0_9BACT|nr:hypothetical protein [Haloferula luteola]MBB5353249.1 hypothetical protein [Haloferula luteola]